MAAQRPSVPVTHVSAEPTVQVPQTVAFGTPRPSGPTTRIVTVAVHVFRPVTSGWPVSDSTVIVAGTAAVTVTCFTTSSRRPPPSVTVNVTVYVPGAA